ncbi:unnamed protein product [Symbiodinium sp. CCMP2592]|nr:unnamed protein product [Symbiodinium sp. CCMP2592]
MAAPAPGTGRLRWLAGSGLATSPRMRLGRICRPWETPRAPPAGLRSSVAKARARA